MNQQVVTSDEHDMIDEWIDDELPAPPTEQQEFILQPSAPGDGVCASIAAPNSLERWMSELLGVAQLQPS